MLRIHFLLSCLSVLFVAQAWTSSASYEFAPRKRSGSLTTSIRADNRSNIAVPEYAIHRRDGNTPDCTNYGGSNGGFCGDLCPCTDSSQYCVAGKCQATPATAFITGCTPGDNTCPIGEDCGFTDATYKTTACGGKYAACTTQDQCHGQYRCVDANYNSLSKGSEDKANCDGVDVGQALVCTYNDKGGALGDSLCQNNDPTWHIACGDIRSGSTLSGKCNGMWTPCSSYKDCWWGWCVNRPGVVSGTDSYCTWIPGPCDKDSDCDNGLKCSPTGMCGGAGATCASNNDCGDPFPCLDDGMGNLRCADWNANTQSGRAVNFENDSGFWSVCTSDDDCFSTSSCGSSNGGSYQVCGGAGASCSSDAQCATGKCNSGNCQSWQNGYRQPGDACQYSWECPSSPVEYACLDDGLGAGRCLPSNSRNARICQIGWVGPLVDCSRDATYGNCGGVRPGSGNFGVCGGDGAKCSTSSDCWTGSCNSTNLCAFGAVPTVALSTKRNLFRKSRCPLGHTMCPVAHGTGFECINTLSTIDSCGGCMTGLIASGQDCTEIENVDEVTCSIGKCTINSCAEGWKPSDDKSSCVLDLE